jgi:hypothetical protein
MNIRRFMREHEALVKKQLLCEGDKKALQCCKANHARMIEYMQHERLIHLLVTLSFGLFLLLSVVLAFMKPAVPVLILNGLFFIMLAAYVAHYFFLENSVQRWYQLMDEIEKRVETSGG